MSPDDVEVIDLTGLSESSDEDELDGNEERAGSLTEGGSEGSDGSEEVEIILNAETRKQLRQAISTVSEDRLRELLDVLISSEPAVEVALTRELVTLKRETNAVVPRWDLCANCDVEFDVNTIRDDDECVFHPGELEVNEKEFADWDEDCHGPIDTTENRRLYPENFSWTCCDKDGMSEGCVHGEHRSAVVRKRKRV
ncbi:hypothetical protein BDQ17DRAFT_1238028 [Cyathus striatus]|nr:hypothetical protein BDQ17DRAFT_1238028 [Cyathus striatus]